MIDSFKKESFEDELCSEFIDQGKDISVGGIIKYLTEYCPDSCFAINYKNKYPFDDYDKELYDYFRYEVLNWCGCGTPEEADKEVLKYLNLIDERFILSDNPNDHYEYIANFSSWYDQYKSTCKEYFGCETIYDNPLLLCLAYTMDAAGFSEHGSGIGGAWITGRGKIYRYAIQKHLEKEGKAIYEN